MDFVLRAACLHTTVEIQETYQHDQQLPTPNNNRHRIKYIAVMTG
jgi:hypothetical protein